MKLKLIILIIFFSLVACVHKKYFTAHPDNNNLQKSALRLNGVYAAKWYERFQKDSIGYYREIPIPYSRPTQFKKEYQPDSFNRHYYLCFFLYQNGVVRQTLFVGSISEIDSINERQFINKNDEYGGYSIKDDSITIQWIRYIPQLHWCVVSYYGKILNDSTIYIYNCFIPDRKDYCKSNFYLNFIKTSPPDSVNRWMKRKWYWE